MPIYAYKCESCGFAKDVLQKMSDAPLTDCPDCHAPAFKKQVTAAGFQLKGSGWYATDFKGGSSASTASNNNESSDSAKSTDSSSATPAAAATPAPASSAGKTDV